MKVLTQQEIVMVAGGRRRSRDHSSAVYAAAFALSTTRYGIGSLFL